jgi:signal transduction histidine kinase
MDSPRERTIERRQVFLYNIYRLVILTSLLVAAFIIQLSSPDAQPNLPFYYLVFGAYAFSAVFFGLYVWGRRLAAQAWLQLVFDLLLITAFVYISGGLASSMYFLYLFPIIAASLVVSGRAGFLTASLAAILFGVLADGIHFGFIPVFRPEHAVRRTLGAMLVTLFVAWGVFFVIAALMSKLTESLRRTRDALRAAERELLVRERLSEAGRVSASLAHEIRNPLAAISGSVQVLKKDLELNEEQQELMAIVLKESERVSQSSTASMRSKGTFRARTSPMSGTPASSSRSSGTSSRTRSRPCPKAAGCAWISPGPARRRFASSSPIPGGA